MDADLIIQETLSGTLAPVETITGELSPIGTLEGELTIPKIIENETYQKQIHWYLYSICLKVK